ncbi:MAG: glycosyltransferase family 4 protein [Deltaproteobacteria bacterium]|nr:glycosyltransferase family 4 protein [Deltaproteobacteria bacterium]
MRILFLTQWFQPEPFFKGLPFAKALREKSHDVEVLTGFPNYPGGKVYPGYRVRFYQRDTMDGIAVHRVALYPSHDKSPLRRILNYLSFSLSAFLLGPWLVGKPDVIYVYNLVTLGPPAFLLRFLFGAKVIIDVQDLWPESVANSKMLGNKFAMTVLNGICGWIYRGADRLTVLSPGFKRELIIRGVAPEKIEVSYNWCDEASIAVAASPEGAVKKSEFAGKFVVLFAGAMGLAQGLDTVLDCARLCREPLPAVQFVLIGGGVDRSRLQKRAEKMGLDNVTFLLPRSMDQAYLYTGKPIIMAMRGDAADLVREASAGIVCEPDAPQEMMNAIKLLYEMPGIERHKMGEVGHRYYMDHLSFNQGVNQFERIMMSLLRKAA